VNRITLEASCDGRSMSVRATELEIRHSTPGHRVHYFMNRVMHYYSGETIRLKLTLPDGSTHIVYSLQATDHNLQSIAEQWIKQIQDALV
jgi:predicted cupin superfamily sugar epimerase